MTNELKTLKDFNVWNPKPRRFYFDEKTKVMSSKPFETVDKEELKAEAIKWVKWLENAKWDEKKEYCSNGDFEISFNDGLKKFILDFFNITEEDLK